METKFRKKEYTVLVVVFYISLTLLGGYLGGLIYDSIIVRFIFAVVGFLFADKIDVFFFTRWEYALTWRDIDLALNNYYRYGPRLGEFWFRAGNRRILIYRNEDNSKNKRARMEVAVPEKEWLDLLSPEERKKIETKTGCVIILYDYGKDQFLFFDNQKIEPSAFCKEILNILVTKAVGGLTPEIMAESHNNLYWLDYSQERHSKIKKRIEARMKKLQK